MSVRGITVGVVGGTGPQGRGLAMRWAKAGIPVRLGSRAAERAAQAAADLRVVAGVEHVTGHANAECVADADVVLVVVPYEGHRELLESLRDELIGKLVVDCVNPIGFDERGPFPLSVPEGSAAQQAEKTLPESTVVAAFHHVSAVLLADPSVSEVDTDVLVLGDDRTATNLVRDLADAIPGTRGIYGGRLRNAHQVEALTANLIAINRRYSTHAGVRLTGIA
jgi:8-hydroxy-5-deazaflavin:NADPH oxidoreductase